MRRRGQKSPKQTKVDELKQLRFTVKRQLDSLTNMIDALPTKDTVLDTLAKRAGASKKSLKLLAAFNERIKLDAVSLKQTLNKLQELLTEVEAELKEAEEALNE